jgi:hypothetical protein
MKPEKITPTQLKKEAQRLIASGKMPSFAALADAIASSPAAQELLKIKLRAFAPESKS